MTRESALLIALLGWLCLLVAVAANGAELKIRVTGLGSGKGEVHYAVYSDADYFPKREGRIAKGAVKAEIGGVTMVVRDLAPGTYAIAVFHDENGNDRFDRGLLGIPLEDYGFSNNPAVFFGPPNFADAAFDLDDKGAEIAIRLD